MEVEQVARYRAGLSTLLNAEPKNVAEAETVLREKVVSDAISGTWRTPPVAGEGPGVPRSDAQTRPRTWCSRWGWSAWTASGGSGVVAGRSPGAKQPDEAVKFLEEKNGIPPA